MLWSEPKRFRSSSVLCLKPCSSQCLQVLHCMPDWSSYQIRTHCFPSDSLNCICICIPSYLQIHCTNLWSMESMRFRSMSVLCLKPCSSRCLQVLHCMPDRSSYLTHSLMIPSDNCLNIHICNLPALRCMWLRSQAPRQCRSMSGCRFRSCPNRSSLYLQVLQDSSLSEWLPRMPSRSSCNSSCTYNGSQMNSGRYCMHPPLKASSHFRSMSDLCLKQYSMKRLQEVLCRTG